MKSVFSLFIALLMSISVFGQVTWSLDKTHSNARFTVTHLVVSEVEGYFKKFDGTITSSKDDFSDAVINFTVDVNSINTENEKRDNHLKSDDFFNAAKYPEMVFRSKSFKKIKGSKYTLTGDLTIREVTKPVKFDVTFGGIGKDGYGNTKAGFKAETVINRFDYNLKWNVITEAGGAVAGKDVTITLKLEFNKGKS